MRKTSTLIFCLVLFIISSFFLPGCGGTDVTSDQERHVFRVGYMREIESLNPHVVWSVQGYEVINLNYNYLMNWDEDLNVIPELASSWEVDETGTLWTFYLQQGVTWQDGEPFTADDVRFTVEYIRDNEVGYFYDKVAEFVEVEVLDEHTVTIKTEEPIAWMPQVMVPILPEHIWSEIDPDEAGGDFANDTPIGTGPFQVIEHRKGEYTRMAVNENYFKGRPALDEVIFMIYANADMMVEALKKGELDIIGDVPTAQFKALEEANAPDIVTLNADSPSLMELAFNVWEDPESLGNPHLRDKNVRIAIEYAIDRQELIDVAALGYGEVGSTLIPPLFDFWHLDLGDDFRDFDPAQAEVILEEAGYQRGGHGLRVAPDGELMSYTLLVRSESPDSQKMAGMIKDMLSGVGIGIEVSVIDEGTLTDRILESDFDMFIWGWFCDVDPTPMLSYMTTNEILGWNDSFYSNSSYDELYLKQQRTMDRDERRSIIHEMQRIFYDDAAYVILSYTPELQAYRSDRYTGWVRNPRTGSVIYTNVVDTYEQLRPIGE